MLKENYHIKNATIKGYYCVNIPSAKHLQVLRTVSRQNQSSAIPDKL